jgi:hypothetical protein
MNRNDLSPAVHPMIARWTYEGQGWEDIHVRLMRLSYVRRSDRDLVRVLCKAYWPVVRSTRKGKIAP